MKKEVRRTEKVSIFVKHRSAQKLKKKGGNVYES